MPAACGLNDTIFAVAQDDLPSAVLASGMGPTTA